MAAKNLQAEVSIVRVFITILFIFSVKIFMLQFTQ